MPVTCILHGSFEDLLPAGHSDNKLTLEVQSPAAVIHHFGIDPEMVHYVIVDGQYVDEESWSTPLSSGSVVRLWPRLAGG